MRRRAWVGLATIVLAMCMLATLTPSYSQGDSGGAGGWGASGWDVGEARVTRDAPAPQPSPLQGEGAAPSPCQGDGWDEGGYLTPACTLTLPLAAFGGSPSRLSLYREREQEREQQPYLPPGLRPPAWPAALPSPTVSATPRLAAGPTPTPLPIPNLPDFQVAYLSRDPTYSAYAVDYPDGWTPVLRAGTENAKRWPDAGEIVTFTAHVANRGPQPAPPTGFVWRIDGQDVLSGTIPALAPGQWISLTLTWAWQPARHWVEFVADTGNTVTEVSEQNNALHEATDALYHDIRVHPYIYEAFSARPNARGSYTFEDWIQAQYAQMNERFAQAIYPEAPLGILERVRINAIRVTLQLDSGLPNYDGGWQFEVERDDPDTPEDEGRQSAERYAAANALGVDWGLIHELTHQIGFIDLYQIGVAMPNVTLPGKDGLPLLMSYGCRNCDLMGGGSTLPYADGTYYSGYAAAAINRNYGHRRGYYGEFMFDIPLTNALVLRDNAGAPLAGAQIEVYQAWFGDLTSTPVISGASDANGMFVLPNRPVSVTITTATGHTLRPNPFGRIDVVGRNGQILIKVSRGGHEDYVWKQILDFNLAFWAGLTQTFTMTWQTHLPPAGAPPPPSLSGRFEQGRVSLVWPAQAGASFYRVYAAREPYYQWQQLVAVSDSGHVATPSWHTRYAVTVVDSAGRESGFSPIHRAFYWVFPSDAFFDARRNRWVVLDTHSGQLVDLLPDGRVVGNQLSPWREYVGGQALDVGAAGETAIVQEATASLYTSQFRRLGYISHAEGEPPRIEQGTGIVMAGEAFSTTVRPDDDAGTLFLAHFDGSFTASGSEALIAGASFTPGVAGEAVRVGTGNRLVYDAGGHFAQEQGGLDFWLRPEWDGQAGGRRVFFAAGGGERYLFEVGAWDGWLYVYMTKGDDYNEVALWKDISAWRAGEWHHLGVGWQPRWLRLYVDGELAEVATLKRPMTGTLATLSVGADSDGFHPAQSAIDELRVSSLARVGNSDRVRLLVAEESKGRIKILDLLGNLWRTWEDGRVTRPRGLALRPGGTVAVSDTGDGSIKLLSYDGQQGLAYHSVFAAGLNRPQNIRSDGERLLVAENGGRLVKIFSSEIPDVSEDIGYLGSGGLGHLLWTYAAPNDGYGGPFGGPAAVARGPAGNLLVADKGKQRVVFIRQGALGERRYLPVIVR